jgi:hypothetical protein
MKKNQDRFTYFGEDDFLDEDDWVDDDTVDDDKWMMTLSCFREMKQTHEANIQSLPNVQKM